MNVAESPVMDHSIRNSPSSAPRSPSPPPPQQSTACAVRERPLSEFRIKNVEGGGYNIVRAFLASLVQARSQIDPVGCLEEALIECLAKIYGEILVHPDEYAPYRDIVDDLPGGRYDNETKVMYALANIYNTAIIIQETDGTPIRISPWRDPSSGREVHLLKTMAHYDALIDKDSEDLKRQRDFKAGSQPVTATGKTFDLFTFENTIEFVLDKFSEQIGDISAMSAAAMKVKAIEQFLEAIDKSWEVMELDIIPFKDKGHFKLRGTDDVYQVLEYGQEQLSTMKASRFVKGFETDVDRLERKRSHILEVIEMVLTVQTQWMYLENIFLVEDIRKQLPRELAEFDEVSVNWKVIMTRISKDRNAVRVTHYKGILETLNEMNLTLKEIQKSLERSAEEDPNMFWGSCSESFKFLEHEVQVITEDRTITVKVRKPDILGKKIAKDQAIEKQDGLSRIFKNGLKDQTHEAKIAVKLVEHFLLYQQACRESKNGEMVQCPDEYKTEKYWNDVFSNETYCNTMFGENIPDDKYQRMVFHFVKKWPKFRDFLIDTAIPEDQKLTILRKQLENIVFFSQRRLSGSKWRMNSTPDEFLKWVLQGPDAQENTTTERVRKIARQTLDKLDVGAISQQKLKGAVPDKIDQNLYDHITQYASKHYNISQPQWTMVRASFERKTDGREIRCYAFSGYKGSSKLNTQHSIPLEYWKYHEFDHKEEDMDIFVCNIDEELVAQNMIVSIFNELKPYVSEDFRNITKHIAFGDEPLALTVRDNRSDLVTLDYEEYFNSVIKFFQVQDKKFRDKIAKVLKGKKLPEELLQEIWTMVSAGVKNQCFVPKEKELKDILGEETAKIIVKMSKEKLTYIKGELDKMPETFLAELKTRLSTCHCGEDNVLSLLLSKFLKYSDVFALSPVEFVALDGNHLDGKPFCTVCDKKVRFYSVLPTFLSELGLKSEDIYGNKDISKQLAVLFEKLAKR